MDTTIAAMARPLGFAGLRDAETMAAMARGRDTTQRTGTHSPMTESTRATVPSVFF